MLTSTPQSHSGGVDGIRTHARFNSPTSLAGTPLIASWVQLHHLKIFLNYYLLYQRTPLLAISSYAVCIINLKLERSLLTPFSPFQDVSHLLLYQHTDLNATTKYAVLKIKSDDYNRKVLALPQTGDLFIQPNWSSGKNVRESYGPLNLTKRFLSVQPHPGTLMDVFPLRTRLHNTSICRSITDLSAIVESSQLTHLSIRLS